MDNHHNRNQTCTYLPKAQPAANSSSLHKAIKLKEQAIEK